MATNLEQWLADNHLQPDGRLLPKGAAIRAMRMRLGWGQEALATKVGLSQSSISRIESGAAEWLSAEVFYELVNCFDCPLRRIALTSDWLGEEEFGRIADEILAVTNIRTIFVRGSKADLRDFYYPTTLNDHAAGSQRTVNCLSDLEGAVLVQAPAGQGKSVFLRYLTANSLAPGRPLPLFFQLGELKDTAIDALVLNRLIALGFEFTAVHVEYLMSLGSVSLILDGFDELEIQLRTSFVTQIEALTKKFPCLQIVISSRPQAQWSNKRLRVYSIAPVTKATLPEVIARYATEDEVNRLADHFVKRAPPITALLTTPLMVALMVLHFRHKDSVPENTIMFYKDLFDVLVHRHNSTDEGLRRPITSHLQTTELQLVFEMMSFLIERDYSNRAIHKRDLDTVIRHALKSCNLTAAPHLVLDDIVLITNLLVEDERATYTYVHRTVREYNAAACICSSQRDAAKLFYESVLSKWPRWIGVLDFLAIADAFQFDRYFRLPDLARFEPFNCESFVEQFQTISVQSDFQPDAWPPTDFRISLGANSAYCMRSKPELSFYVSQESLILLFEGRLPEMLLNSRIEFRKQDHQWSRPALAKLAEGSREWPRLKRWIDGFQKDYRALCEKLQQSRERNSDFQV